jgi:transcriptional regulator GlxA family with amidase domain
MQGGPPLASKGDPCDAMSGSAARVENTRQPPVKCDSVRKRPALSTTIRSASGRTSSARAPQVSPADRISAALHFIEAHYSERLTGVMLAHVTGLERSHFVKLFRCTIGRTLHDYITDRRVQRACDLLRQGLKVEAVSLAVGFPSRGTFYRAFRAETAMTPAAYRLSYSNAARKADPTEQDTNPVAP